MPADDDKKPGFWKRAGGIFSKGKSAAGSALSGGGTAAAAGIGMGIGVVGGVAYMGARGVRGIFSLMGNGFTWILLIFVIALHTANITQGVATTFSSASSAILAGFIMCGLLAGFVVYRSEDGAGMFASAFKFVLLGIATYLLPVLVAYSRDAGWIPREIAAIFIIWTPLFVLYIFSNPGGSIITRWLAAIYFIGLTLYILMGVILPLVSDGAPQVTAIVLAPGELRAQVVHVWQAIFTPIKKLPVAIIKGVNETVKGKGKELAPELFVGQVDKNQGPPLGVYHANGKALLDKFRVDLGDSVSTTTELRTRTLSETESYIDTKCTFQTQDLSSFRTKRMLTSPGEVTPRFTVLTYSGEVQDVSTVECTVKNSELIKNGYPSSTITGDITMNSTFNFSTSGYVTYAFMDRTLFESLRQSNKNPATEMGLPGGRQIAKYTPGPVSIGMPAESLPIPYDDIRAPSIPPLGLTFSSTQTNRGGIQKFNSVEVFVPRQFEIDKDKCSPAGEVDPVTKVSTGVKVDETTTDVMGPAYQGYSITNILNDNRDYGQFITIRCAMRIRDGMKNNVLGPTGTSIYTILVQANYTFSVDSKVPVTLMVKPKPSNTIILGGGPNLDVAVDESRCNSVAALCDKKGSTSKCACYYSPLKTATTAPDSLRACTWDRPEDDVLTKFASKACSVTSIPADCDSATRCLAAGACSCSRYVNGKQYKYFWPATNPANCNYVLCTSNPDTGAYDCAESTSGTKCATPP